jgi:hypothetical protein
MATFTFLSLLDTFGPADGRSEVYGLAQSLGGIVDAKDLLCPKTARQLRHGLDTEQKSLLIALRGRLKLPWGLSRENGGGLIPVASAGGAKRRPHWENVLHVRT